MGGARADGVLPDDGDIGEFDVRAYKADGIKFWDAIDPDLFDAARPAHRRQFALSQVGDPSYKRLARTISVPAGGAHLSFWVHRDTEPGWDFFFVEAHTRRRRLDDPARPQRSHQPGHRLRLPVLARAPPVPRALPDRQRRRHLLAHRYDGRLVGGLRVERRLRAVDRRPRAYAGGTSRCLSRYASDDVVQDAGV